MVTKWGRGWGRGWGRDKLGVWVSNIYTIIYKIETNKDLLYSTGNYTQNLVITGNGRECKKRIYIYISESLCCTAEINTTL